MTDSDESITATLTRKLAAERERKKREAIRETDWSETAVLRIVTRQPLQFEPVTPAIEVSRYESRAPPVSDHADGEHKSEVLTLTRPLLARLADEYLQLRELVDDD